MPIGTRGWRWFGPKVLSASPGTKAALVALGVFAAFCYAFLGPLVFDAAYWVLGKIARTAADRRLRVGLSVAFVALYLVALGVSGSTAPKSTVGDSASRVVAANVASPSASVAVSTATGAVTSASPVASADADDETSGSPGASFAPDATGIVATGGGGTPDDRMPGEPDPNLTPGALNPAVTPATINSTICVSGWTATIRPSSSYTTALKIQQIAQYGYSDTSTSSYEEDHLIPLELGGAPADPRNLWPEPYTISLADGRSTGAYTKDGFETKLKNQVCAGTATLAQAQSEIGDHWVHAYYGIALVVSPTNPATTAIPTSAVTAPPTTPVVTPPPVALSVSITILPASINPGANATMVAVTSPGASCSARVTYASGTVSTAPGLQTHPVADSSGSVSWTWKVGSNTGSGTATAAVTCTLGGASASASKTFVVT